MVIGRFKTQPTLNANGLHIYALNTKKKILSATFPASVANGMHLVSARNHPYFLVCFECVRERVLKDVGI